MGSPDQGTIFPQAIKYYPDFTQPGGPNTPTFPQQGQSPPDTGLQPPGPRNELTGQFMAGCGHSFMSWEVSREAVGGVPSAFVCCPYCGFIQSIWTPYTLLDQFPMIVG